VQAVGNYNANGVDVWVIGNCAPIGIVTLEPKSLSGGKSKLGVYIANRYELDLWQIGAI
jgi:hypothetical protein